MLISGPFINNYVDKQGGGGRGGMLTIYEVLLKVKLTNGARAV